MRRLFRMIQVGAVLCLSLAWSAGPARDNPVSPAGAAPQATVITLSSGQRILYSGLATADFNGDGRKEIVAGGGDGKLHVVSYNGTSWSEVWAHDANVEIEAAGPPTHKATTEIYSTPAIADLDNDGRLEIVVAVGGDIHVPIEQRENGGVLVYRYNSAWNFSLIESLSADGSRGWPQPRIDRVGNDAGYGSPDGYWDGIITAPAVGDLDGDGDLEIVVEGIDRRIWAWHHTGQSVAGWPIYRDNGDHLLRGGLSSPALGDIDGDSLPEVVAGTMSPPWDGVNNPDYTRATVWAINGDSTNVPGFPAATEQVVHSSPALGDIDQDGQPEIVVGVGWGTSGRTNIIYALEGNGTPLSGWGPRATSSSSDILFAPPALGDIDNDGELEIVIGCGNSYDPNSCGAPHAKLYAWNDNGSAVSGFPQEPPSPNSWLSGSFAMPFTPILADIDGDSHVEILVVHIGAHGITVMDAVSGAADNTSHLFSGGLSAPPVVDDVDNDGKLEVLAGGGASDQATSNAVIRVWDENGSASAAPPWPMHRHDARRTGRFALPPKLGFPSELRFLHPSGSGSTETRYATIQNLGEGQFNWTINNTVAGLQVIPTSGTVVTQTSVRLNLTTTGYPAGWSQLSGNVTIAGTYTGTVVESSPKTATVWLYIGDVSRVYLPIVKRNQ